MKWGVKENDKRDQGKAEQICDTDNDGEEVNVTEHRCDAVMEGNVEWWSGREEISERAGIDDEKESI